MDYRNIIPAVFAVFLLGFALFNALIYTSDTRAEDFEIRVENVTSENTSVYGTVYKINATIGLSKDAGSTVVTKYKHTAGTMPNGLKGLFTYRIMEPGDEINASMEQDAEKGERVQEDSIEFIPVVEGFTRNMFQQVGNTPLYGDLRKDDLHILFSGENILSTAEVQEKKFQFESPLNCSLIR
jgi:hypothetical protein